MYNGRLLKAIVGFEDIEVIADVSCTYEQIRQGLSGISKLEENEGMLFILMEPTPFVMEGMKISIDMIWMNRAHEIVALLPYAKICKEPPCPKYLPDEDFSYVLEVKAGFIKRHKLEVGEIIPFDID